jgi:hypothetical protein
MILLLALVLLGIPIAYLVVLTRFLIKATPEPRRERLERGARRLSRADALYEEDDPVTPIQRLV